MYPTTLLHNNVVRLRLKPISIFLIVAEILDLMTTLQGFRWFPQLWESNPLAGLYGGMTTAILAKVLVTLCVVFIFERVDKWPRLVWLVPAVAWLPVLWNILVIWAEFISVT
jgi:hypothetical protein